MGQLSLAPDEPLAAEPRGHGSIVPHRHGAPTHRYPPAVTATSAPGSLWSNRSFGALWSAGAVSIFRSPAPRTALPWAAILVLDAGAMDVAALRGVEQVAALIVGLFARAGGGRLDRRARASAGAPCRP